MMVAVTPRGIWNPNGIFKPKRAAPPKPVFRDRWGQLYDGDCLEILPWISDKSIDTVFADPPFNIGKRYGKKVNDDRPEAEYISWCKQWLDHCVRVLKPGGSLFVYNLPKWNIRLAAYLLSSDMLFRHWIAVDMNLGLPIPNRLYPSHYSLLYFTKGKPNTFHSIRTPIKVCRYCKRDVKDYGGHRRSINPNGVNLTDVWDDIPPVRHWRFKSKKRRSNQLSTKLLNRVIGISTKKRDVVLDPFGGAGTTFDVCEHMGRHWIGVELQHSKVIIERLRSGTVHHHPNTDHLEE